MEIADRLREVMQQYDLTSSGFAEQIGVQRSSISHILSGRNKPSLDFIQKLLEHLPEVDAAWLISGRETGTEFVLPLPPPKAPQVAQQAAEPPPVSEPENKEIEQVVVFYTDKTFDTYLPAAK